MRAVLVCGWVLFATGSALARADDPKFGKVTLATIGEGKPAAEDGKDSPSRQLLKEPYNTGLAQVQAIARLHGKGVIGRGEIGPAVRRLAYLEAELFEDPNAGVRWLELWAATLVELERVS